MTTAIAGLPLALAACDPAASQRLLNPLQAENVHLLPRIKEQVLVRDNCLSSYVAQHDNFEERIENVARSAADACTAEDDKLIELLLQMDQDGRPQITAAVRKESSFQAYRIVLRERAVPEKRQKATDTRPTPVVEWR